MQVINSELQISKKLWKSKVDFKTVANQAALHGQEKKYIPNYVVRDPSEPPMIHKFRMPVDKTKFVGSKPFRVS